MAEHLLGILCGQIAFKQILRGSILSVKVEVNGCSEVTGAESEADQLFTVTAVVTAKILYLQPVSRDFTSLLESHHCRQKSFFAVTDAQKLGLEHHQRFRGSCLACFAGRSPAR